MNSNEVEEDMWDKNNMQQAHRNEMAWMSVQYTQMIPNER